MKKKLLLSLTGSLMTFSLSIAQNQPSIIIIYTDDMGIENLSCYNSGWVETPNIDKLAYKGLKFNNYYTNSPISFPSSVGLTTGMFPTKWGINTYLHDRKGNANCEQFDYLSSDASIYVKSNQLVFQKRVIRK